MTMTPNTNSTTLSRDLSELKSEGLKLVITIPNSKDAVRSL